MDRLNLLAVQLTKCRRRGNKLTLESILESARILTEAKALPGGGFGKWLAEQARMDRATAFRHIGVARFVHQNVALMRQIATLGVAKVYALSAIDSALAIRILTGQTKFSAPLDLISDAQFRREFREKFPARSPRHTRQHVFQAMSSALTRAERAVQHASTFVRKLTAAQRSRIEQKVGALVKLISSWKVVA
jgi:hypothetical protein